MSDRPVNFTPSGPPETELDPEPAEARTALAEALASGTRDDLADVVSRWPRYLEAWARLGDAGRDSVESYAYYRIGYHRGLDRLRANGWRGSGYVRWAVPENQGFLRALDGLCRTAEAIGETDEAERCGTFLQQLDPNWPPDDIEA
jgi:hypothetical protein